MIVTGCGGGVDGSQSAAITKATFLKRGNAICAKGNKEIEEGIKRFEEENALPGAPLSREQLIEAIEVVVLPVVREQIEGVEALGIPDGEESQIEAIHEVDREALEKAESDPSSLTTEQTNPFTEANRLAVEYGLVKCSG